MALEEGIHPDDWKEWQIEAAKRNNNVLAKNLTPKPCGYSYTKGKVSMFYYPDDVTNLINKEKLNYNLGKAVELIFVANKSDDNDTKVNILKNVMDFIRRDIGDYV